MWLLLWGVVGLGCGLLGVFVATEKRRSQSEGFLLGFLFGPIGAVIVALLPTGDRTAPKRPSVDGDYVPPKDPRRLNAAERHRERQRRRRHEQTFGDLPDVPAEDLEDRLRRGR